VKVVAEGAETAKQVSILKTLKCEFVQGYFFAPPDDHVAVQALLSKERTNTSVFPSSAM
jgi:EAL domain-containing protein (putative c-di-GMP-specific phosphodiesterase class I)